MIRISLGFVLLLVCLSQAFSVSDLESLLANAKETSEVFTTTEVANETESSTVAATTAAASTTPVEATTLPETTTTTTTDSENVVVSTSVFSDLEANDPVRWGALLRTIYEQQRRVQRFAFLIERNLYRNQFAAFDFFGQTLTSWRPELLMDYFQTQVDLLNDQIDLLIRDNVTVSISVN